MRGVGGLAIIVGAFITPICATGASTGKRAVLCDREHHWSSLAAVRRIYRKVSWEICGELRCLRACVTSCLQEFLVVYMRRHVERNDGFVGGENGRNDHVVETLLKMED